MSTRSWKPGHADVPAVLKTCLDALRPLSTRERLRVLAGIRAYVTTPDGFGAVTAEPHQPTGGRTRPKPAAE